MKSAALVLAACCLAFVACDDDDDDDDYTPTAPAVAPVPVAGALNPPVNGPPAGNRAPTLVVRTRTNGNNLHVDMCSSNDPDNDNLNYKYLWGDGTRQYEEHAGFCAQTHSYGGGRRRVIVCVDDGWPVHEVCDNFIVQF
jgi:hypothetical protein